jgi:hypothetical protein
MHIGQQGTQERSMRNTDPRFSVGLLTVKPVYMASYKPKNTELTKIQRMWDKVECLTWIKINGISLFLRASKRGSKIDISYQIGEGKFRFREAVLIMINFKLLNTQKLKGSNDGV